ncbi:hypothetical protein BC835DRAFT_1412415 [Cytidiella melzeri]|nr:hypothetical protein BC835DRAFT_1412415 [Cytidiella melzeri]
MRSYIAVTLALLAAVGPAVPAPVASPTVSSDAPSDSYPMMAVSGNDVDESAAMQLVPALNMSRRSGESTVTNFVELLARGGRFSSTVPVKSLQLPKLTHSNGRKVTEEELQSTLASFTTSQLSFFLSGNRNLNQLIPWLTEEQRTSLLALKDL